MVELELVEIENPDELNLILGMSHFIKTAEDVHEAIRAGVADCCGYPIARLCRNRMAVLRSDGAALSSVGRPQPAVDGVHRRSCSTLRRRA